MILVTFPLHYMLMLLVHVASVCPPCCMLLGVVTQSLKPVKLSTTCKRTQQVRTLSGQQSWELLRPFARSLIPKSDQHQFSNIQQCWELLANNVASVRTGLLKG